MNQDRKLSLKAKLGFGAGEFSSSAFFTLTSFWLLNFLTDEVGLAAGLAGTALLVGKVWDSVVDPFIGVVTDRTHSRWGRRRPYLLFFGIPFGVALFLMFRNPGLTSDGAKFAWALVMYVVLCTAYSFTNIPYNALLPELTRDFDERTSITGYKMSFAVVGTLLGAGLAVPIMGLFPNRTAGFAGMGALFGLLVTISILLPFFAVREPTSHEAAKPVALRASLGAMAANKPFVLLLTAWTVNTTGVAAIQATLIYYYKYIFGAPDAVTLALVILLVTSLAFIPLWVRLSRRVGKRNAYVLGMSITILAVLLFAFFGRSIGAAACNAIMVLAGVGFSSHYVLPWAMVPDTIEHDYAATGVRREGVYYGLWAFVVSLGGALASFIVGTGLGLFGYVPDVAQTARSILGIQLLAGPVSAFFFLAGNLALAFYPIDRARYAEIQRAIEAREQAGGVAS